MLKRAVNTDTMAGDARAQTMSLGMERFIADLPPRQRAEQTLHFERFGQALRVGQREGGIVKSDMTTATIRHHLERQAVDGASLLGIA